MKHYFILSIAALACLQLTAQVPKKTVVEHFTNTKCSICASRNPGFYANLSNHPGVLHLAIHPSSPYSGCLLYQQNSIQNDARTNYYGIYGGTPRIVINGSVIAASVNYSDGNIFMPYLSQTSPALIKIRQSKFGNDSIKSEVIIKTVATHSLGALSLFTALTEDTVFYTGSNGEPRHFDVFRHALSPISGASVNLPPNVGDSIVMSFTATPQPFWNFSRIGTLVILQETLSKNVVQAERSTANGTIAGLGNEPTISELKVYPNPCTDILNIENTMAGAIIEIRDPMGRLLLHKELEYGRNEMVLDHHSSGIYFATLLYNNAVISKAKLLLMNN